MIVIADNMTDQVSRVSMQSLKALRAISAADNINSRHLRYFLAVAETGTVTAAADLLHMSQPSLSQQILWLEKEVGQKLFRRDGRGMHLTPAGAAFRDCVQDIPDRLHNAISKAESVASRPEIRVAVCSCIDYTVVETAVEDVTQTLQQGRHAAPEVVLKPTPSFMQVTALKRGVFDLGVLRAPISDDGLVIHPLSNDSFHVVMRRDHEAASREPLRWDDLLGYPLIWVLHLDSPHLSEMLLDRLRRVTPGRRLVRAHDNHPAVLGRLFHSEPDALMLCSSSTLDGLPHLVHRKVAQVPYLDPIVLATAKNSPYAPLLESLSDGRSGPEQRGRRADGHVGEELVI